MANKKLNSLSDLGLVFSTGSTDSFSSQDGLNEESVSKETQHPRILLDRKKRKGKSVTIIAHLEESDEMMTQLAKNLKSKCGVGGNAKDGEIMLQGDQRKKVLAELIKLGYKHTKLSGG